MLITIKECFKFTDVLLTRKRDLVDFVIVHRIELQLFYLIAHFSKAKILSIDLINVALVEFGNMGFPLHQGFFANVEDIDFPNEVVFFAIDGSPLEDIFGS
jgi:hypothetical protein